MPEDLVTRLRQTRADMIGTDDESHYWDCHDAAAEIERLRGEALSAVVAGKQQVTVTVREILNTLRTICEGYERVLNGMGGFEMHCKTALVAVRGAISLIHQVPVWIPVDEMLPQPDPYGNSIAVLVYLPGPYGGEIAIGFCDQDDYGVRWQCQSTKKPSHWMPLPHRPEVGD